MHSMDAKLNKIDNWFFKKNYMDLGPGYKKRFDYTQSFRSRALNQILAEYTGQPLEVINADTERDNFMTAEEAKAYGLIDDVNKHR